jgi:hypothetical protein
MFAAYLSTFSSAYLCQTSIKTMTLKTQNARTCDMPNSSSFFVHDKSDNLIFRHYLSHYKSSNLQPFHSTVGLQSNTMIKIEKIVIGFVIFALLFESSLQQGDSIIQSSEEKIIQA